MNQGMYAVWEALVTPLQARKAKTPASGTELEADSHVGSYGM